MRSVLSSKQVICWLLVGLLPLAARCEPARPGADATRTGGSAQIPLRSVLLRDRDVFASNAEGLFHAVLTEKKWRRLSVPDSMPLDGYFATQPVSAGAIFYYVPEWIAQKAPGAKAKTSGLYLSRDSGLTWRLISKDHDFYFMLLHKNGQLFGIDRYHVEENGRTYHRQRILMSSDEGQTWRDITGRAAGVERIFPDPDHPELVCLSAIIIRPIVYQAQDQNYEWKSTRLWDWMKNHQTDEAFLEREYSAGWIYYTFRATLANYFEHDFGNRVELPAFDIVPRRIAGVFDTYVFNKDGPKIVQVEVRFLRAEHVTLLDLRRDLSFWGIKVISPDGKRTFLYPRAGTAMMYQSEKPADVRERLTASGELRSFNVSKMRPHSRLIDLEKLFRFDKIGIYRVQLLYANGALAERERKEWIGSFGSRTFTVVVQ